MTPWGPLILVALVAVGGALLVTSLTGRLGYGLATLSLLLAIASAAFGMIATVAFVWAAGLVLVSLAFFMGARRPH